MVARMFNSLQKFFNFVVRARLHFAKSHGKLVTQIQRAPL